MCYFAVNVHKRQRGDDGHEAEQRVTGDRRRAADFRNGKVSPPVRIKNSDRREREYLTPVEAEHMIEAARRRGRWGARDAALILIAYRHGLRVSELVGLRWDAVDMENKQLHVARRKNGKPSVQPLGGSEIRELRKLKRDADGAPFVFLSERRGPLTTSALRYIVAQAGKAAGLSFPVHPHMLRLPPATSSPMTAGHARDPGLPRPQEHHPHDALHGTGVESV